MLPERIVIVRAVQTSIACPSQWDLWDSEGRYLYARYRHGCGDVRQYKSENWVDAPACEDPEPGMPGSAYRTNSEFIRHVTGFRYGHPLDGSMSLDEFAEHAGLELAENLMYSSFGDYLADKLILEGIVGPEVLEQDG
jgi:hypothetical protein